MDFSQVIASGLIGVVSSIVINSLVKKGWFNKTYGWIVLFFIIAIWNASIYYFNRDLSGRNITTSVESVIDKISTFQVIKEYDFETYISIKNKTIAIANQHVSEQELIDAIQPDILKLQKERMLFATNPWVVDVIKLNIEQIVAIQKISPEKCFRYLFPGVKGGINPARLLSNDILKRRIATDTEMMRSSYSQNRHIITEDETDRARENLRSVAKSLIIKYGSDIDILDQPIKGLGKEKIACELVKTMWEKVVNFPEEEAAGITRLILSS